MENMMNLTKEPDETEEKRTSGPSRKKPKGRKSLIIETGYYILLAIVLLAAVISMNNSQDEKPGFFFGYAGLSVLTESMESEIPRGSLIIIKRTEPGKLEIGDDITFLYSGHMTVTHRVIDIYENYGQSEDRGFRTMGVDNSSPDNKIVIAEDVVGKVVFHSKALGDFLGFIKGGFFLSILLIALILGLIFCFWRMFKGPDYFEYFETADAEAIIAEDPAGASSQKIKRARKMFSGTKTGTRIKSGLLTEENKDCCEDLQKEEG